MGRVPVLDLKRKRPSEASQDDGLVVSASGADTINRSAVNPLDMLSNELHAHNMTAMDSIIDCNMKRNGSTNGIVDYRRKRSSLFHFEKQLNGNNETYFGRFGDYFESPSTDCLLNDSFDIIQVAKECRKEEEDSDDYE